MAEVDSLDIQISASAQNANKSIDMLIKKLNTLSSSLNIDTSGLENQSQEIAKNFSAIVNQSREMSRSISYSVQNVIKPMEELQKSVTEIAAKCDKAIDLKIDVSESKAVLKKFQGDLSAMSDAELDEWFNNLPSIKAEAEQAAQSIQDSFSEIKIEIPSKSFNYDAGAMKAVFGEATDGINNWNAAVERFGENAGIAINEMGTLNETLEENSDKARLSREKLEELNVNLKKLEVPPIREENLGKLRSALEKAETKLEELRTNLKNGLKMGDITVSADDSKYVKIREQITLAEKTVEALQEKIAGLGTARGDLSSIASLAQKIIAIFSKPITFFPKLVSGIGSANRALSAFKDKLLSLVGINTNKSFSSRLKMILKYSLGIRSLYMLFRKIRTAISEGYENLKKFPSEVSTRISELSTKFSILKNSVVMATTPIVNAFAPALKYIIDLCIDGVNYINQLISALTGRNTWIKVAGVVDDYADSVKNASDAAKNALLSFDEINKISDTSSSDSGTSDAEEVSYDELDVESGIADFAERIKQALKAAWESGDASGIGQAIASWLNNGIDWVIQNTSQWASNLNKLSNLLSTSINGFTYNFNWDGLGTAIGTSLKAWIDSSTNFFLNTDWTALGSGLGRSLNAFVDSKALQSILANVAAKLRAAIEFAFGTITTFNFTNLGSAIGQGINDFLATMGKINRATGLSGWQALGKSLSKSITGIADALITALDTVNWEDVGEAVADFLQGIDWLEVIKAGFKLNFNIWKAIAEVWFSAMDAAPIETSIISAIALLKFTNLGSTLAGAMAAAPMTETTFSAFATKFAGVFSTALIGVVAGAGLGEKIAKNFFGEDDVIEDTLETFENGEWAGALDEIGKEVLKLSGAVEPVNDSFRTLDSASSSAADKLDILNMSMSRLSGTNKTTTKSTNLLGIELSDSAKKALSSSSALANNRGALIAYDAALKNYNNTASDVSSTVFSTKSWTFSGIASGLVGTLGSAVSNAKEKFSNILSSAKTTFASSNWNFTGIKSGLSTAFTNAYNAANTNGLTKIYDKAKEKFGNSSKWNFTEVKTGLSNTFTNAFNAVKTVVNSFVTAFNNVFNIKTSSKSSLQDTLNSIKLGTIGKFATGGFPEDGLFFANSTELVGKFSNGKTAVANNSEITAGIEEAAYKGMLRALTQAQGNSGTNVNVTLQGDAKKLFTTVRTEAYKYANQTRTTPFPV